MPAETTSKSPPDEKPDTEQSPEPETAEESEKPAAKKAGDEKSAPKPSASRDVLRPVSAALCAIAAIAFAWASWTWYAAAHDDARHYSVLRDRVLNTAEQEIQNLNTLDYRQVDRSLKAWQDSATSDLYNDIAQGKTQFTQQVQQAQTVTTGKVLEGAVTELDEHAGRARVIVAIQITVTPPKGDPVVKRSRLIGELTRTPGGWKISALGQAPVGS
ncbi:hypothetical protein [Actinomadura rupiterrae]|uniref:hypothetical protein n=1 Tax=Actinomadura rupiterrae TaxID=559627 RepID=UPI0020A44894|nr:hypothetical protein [Actinomadura rupiterrae]MCP2339116.1 Mce-associated membrane protein [Actinomadura rupiterrae]